MNQSSDLRHERIEERPSHEPNGKVIGHLTKIRKDCQVDSAHEAHGTLETSGMEQAQSPLLDPLHTYRYT